MKTYKIYTDGAATMRQINGEYVREAGGWAFLVIDEKDNACVFQNYGYKAETTNNEMELTAICKALHWAYENLDSGDTIEICSDSAYCVNIYTQWISSWKKNGWTRGKKHEPIENLGIIKITDELLGSLTQNFMAVKFTKVKGHADDFWNNQADTLAVKGKMKDFGDCTVYSIL